MQLMDKKEYDGAIKLVEEAGASEKSVNTIRKLVQCKGNDTFEVIKRIKELVKDCEKSVEAAENLQKILELTKESGCKIDASVDAGFARGLEYYTGMVFEVFVQKMEIALGGGGRYDRLVELFGGEPTPAVGVAHGIDRIMLGIQSREAAPSGKKAKTVFVLPITKEQTVAALEISQRLRDAGISVEVEVMGRKMTKALEDADRRKLDYAIIVGERELREESVVIRDLVKRQQNTVKTEEILKQIKG
jgi:histidyl-tRNA synthetase